MLSEWDDTAAYLPLANKVKSQSHEERAVFRQCGARPSREDGAHAHKHVARPASHELRTGATCDPLP